MIENGDKIAVGVSGKDSITLLIALRRLQEFLNKKFSVEAVTLTLGIGKYNLDYIQELCNNLEINYTVEETLIGKIVFEVRKEKNPCSLCANMRRGALNNLARKLGCNKVALGHHRDDLMETLLLNILFEGKISTFSPVTYLSRMDLNVIRPLIYTKEEDIKEFINANNIISIKNPCQIDGLTKRQYIKNLLGEISKDNKYIKENIFGAIRRSKIEGWDI
ncbi:tRNA 2-thiocytidine biosynthesis TtcA family protein [Acetivibrio saccincola]|nr:tRNA 2-thiocytidine biosynthesis TtcA family protein [Acetivibrio saccincola]NLW25883.1 tRNA 2-thiocytidine(32) synthetase TtcA [Acetivibrio saccincola]PQQ68280.1 tRNA 2-thiocytidine(32) synthetase TtcA [Acetivibrio saccincola]HOA97252.1 ATP-binding protein [Acetivibrio saccincola]HQD28324.1 ATP-binding protein [Acetivibrio saccincola]